MKKTIQEIHQESIADFKNQIIGIVSQMFASQGHVAPVVFALVSRDKDKFELGVVAGLGELFVDEQGKDQAADILRQISKELKPLAIAFASEGYASTYLSKDLKEVNGVKVPPMAPSLDPSRKEILFIKFETHAEEAFKHWEICRDGNTELKPIVDTDWTDKKDIKGGGRFSDLLQENYTQFANQLKEHLNTSLN